MLSANCQVLGAAVNAAATCLTLFSKTAKELEAKLRWWISIWLRTCVEIS